MIAGLRPCSQNVIFKQTLSVQARKKRQKAKLDGFVKRQKEFASLLIKLDQGHVDLLSEYILFIQM